MITVKFKEDLPGINTEDPVAFDNAIFGGFVSDSPNVTFIPPYLTIRDPLTNWAVMLVGNIVIDGEGFLSLQSTIQSMSVYNAAGFGIMWIDNLPSVPIGAILDMPDGDLSALFEGQGIQVTGTNNNDVLGGVAGSDSLNGLFGDDIYYVGAGDTIADPGGVDTVRCTVSWVLGDGLENLELLSGAVSGTGNFLNNTITGNSGNNLLDGGAGADTLIGGAGNDSYFLDSGADTVAENPGEGIDTVFVSFNYSLGPISNLENVTLTGV